MKKAMIIAAALFAAFAAKASTVGWNYEGMILDKDDGYDSNGLAWVVFLGNSTDISAISVTETGTLNAGDNAVRAQGLILDNMAVANDNYEALQTVENVSGNFVLVGAYQDVGSGKWFYGVTDPLAVTVAANNDTDTVYANLGSSNFSLVTPGTPVPEPTSVALLALGLAALGLKRKVA